MSKMGTMVCVCPDGKETFHPSQKMDFKKAYELIGCDCIAPFKVRFRGRVRDAYVDDNGLRLGPAFLREAAHIDPFEGLEAFDGPVKVIHGSNDPIAPVARVAPYADAFSGPVDYDIIEGADHFWMNLEHRDRLQHGAADFIAGRAELSSE